MLLGHGLSPCQKAASDWPYRHSLSLGLPQNPAPARMPDGVSRCTTKEPEELVQHKYWPSAAPHHLRPGNTAPPPALLKPEGVPLHFDSDCHSECIPTSVLLICFGDVAFRVAVESDPN